MGSKYTSGKGPRYPSDTLTYLLITESSLDKREEAKKII